MAEGLLERHEELAVLAAAVQRLASGAGAVVVLSGPAGIGKSAVAERAVRDAAAQGLTVLSAVANERTSGVAFGIAVELFATVGDLRPLLVGTAQLAAPAFDRAQPAAGRATARVDGVTEGLWRIVEHLAGEGPVVIWVDDAQWCDEPSLRLLQRITQQLADIPVLLIVGVRLGQSLPDALTALRVAATTELRLEALSPAAVADLAARSFARPVSEAFAQACWDTTRGNPYLVTDLLRAARAAGMAPADRAVGEIRRLGGTTVGSRVAARLEAMPAPARRVAAAVAVLGEHAALDDVARVAGLDRAQVTDIAARLAAAGILLAVEPLRFIHPLVATAVYGATDPGQREELHAAAAAAHAQDGAPAVRLAPHLLETAPGAGPWVADTLAAAATEVLAAGDAGLAVRYLTRALRETLRAPRAAALRVELGVAKVTAGDPSGTDDVEVAAQTLAGDDRARALFALGRLHAVLGDRGAAAHAFDRGWAVAEDPDLAKELGAGFLFAALLHAPLAEEAQARLVQLVERDPGTGDSPGERRALAFTALQHSLSCGDREEALRLARRALHGAELTADDSPDGPFFSILTGVFLYTGALREGIDLCNGVLQQARQRGLFGGYATALYCRGTPRYQSGDINGATADFATAVEAGERGWQLYWVAALGLYARILLERGELDAARQLVDVDHTPWRDTVEYVLVLEALGAVRHEQGRPREALDALLEAGRLATEAGLINPIVVDWRSRAAAAATDVGDTALARRLAAEELELSRQWGADLGVAQSLCAVAALERGHDRVALLEEAYAATDRSDAKYWRLRAGIELGAALRQTGDEASARHVLRPLVETAAMSGAVVLRDRAVRELSAAGGRPRRLPTTPLGSLTPAEHQVVTLVAAGLRNRDVAEALFVTEKAVERHLSAAYRKLGVSSRVELATVIPPSE